MKIMLKVISYVATFVFAFIIASAISNSRANRCLYAQDLETHVANVNISVAVLEKLRSKQYDEAIAGLEAAMLTETLGLEDDEKVIGWNADMEGAANKIAVYCTRFNIFDGKTNLPSHLIAKRFLDSHAQKK